LTQRATIDFSTYGEGKLFDNNYYQAEGIVFTGRTNYWAGYIQGDAALTVHKPYPMMADFLIPVNSLSLQYAAGGQGWQDVSLTALDINSQSINSVSLSYNEYGSAGYKTINLVILSRPTYSFILEVISGDGGVSSITFSQTPVPEPTSLLLLGTGLVGLMGLKRKRH